MRSMVTVTNGIDLPLYLGEQAMTEFDLNTLAGLPTEFVKIARAMLLNIKHCGGKAFFTIHGKKLMKGETLRRGGAHTDGNYEPHQMTFGGGGWKVGQDGPSINTQLHARQYNTIKGGILLASNYESCLGWVGDYKGLPKTGGDCSHIELDKPFMLEKNKVYCGNNHFIHESLPLSGDVHRVMVRITMPEHYEYKQHQI